MQSDTLTYDEVAQYLRLSKSTVRNLCKNKAANFPPIILIAPRTHRFRLADIQLYALHGAKWSLYART